MQNTQYTNAVTAAITRFANTIANCAHDSVAENNDYAIHDSVDSIQFLYDNYTKYDNVNCLANAALSSNLDTAVRENIHAQLTFVN
jgi:hypothetical protein